MAANSADAIGKPVSSRYLELWALTVSRGTSATSGYHGWVEKAEGLNH
jgi:hypothetical protein